MQSKFNQFIERSLLKFRSLNKDFFATIDDTPLTYTHWNWDYQDAISFQEDCVNYVRENRMHKIYIFCNHPHCFTLGRGLQKGKGNLLESLKGFDPTIEKKLTYKIYRIKRGGGLTFHFPGQWIFYPIINLNNHQYNLKEITYGLLDGVKQVLESDYRVSELETRREFLGLWRGSKKLASVGIGVKHFVTFHGIAFNIVRDELIFKELNKINPCGLDATTYQCLNEIIHEKTQVSCFHQQFLKSEAVNLLKLRA